MNKADGSGLQSPDDESRPRFPGLAFGDWIVNDTTNRRYRFGTYQEDDKAHVVLQTSDGIRGATWSLDTTLLAREDVKKFWSAVLTRTNEWLRGRNFVRIFGAASSESIGHAVQLHDITDIVQSVQIAQGIDFANAYSTVQSMGAAASNVPGAPSQRRPLPAPTRGRWPRVMPKDVGRALEDIQSGADRPNVRNPKPFTNDGRGGSAMLPKFDADGNEIVYIEHTVNPRPPGGQLDKKRIVMGSDGSIRWTDDHFETMNDVSPGGGR